MEEPPLWVLLGGGRMRGVLTLCFSLHGGDKITCYVLSYGVVYCSLLLMAKDRE